MIIGRTLRKIPVIGKYLFPIKKMGYGTGRDKEGNKTFHLYEESLGWYPYNDVPQVLDKVFEKRRTVDVGEDFEVEKCFLSRTYFGTRLEDINARRIGKDTIVVHPRGTKHTYLVSTSEEDLLENRSSGYTPVLYKGVIY